MWNERTYAIFSVSVLVVCLLILDFIRTIVLATILGLAIFLQQQPVVIGVVLIGCNATYQVIAYQFGFTQIAFLCIMWCSIVSIILLWRRDVPLKVSHSPPPTPPTPSPYSPPPPPPTPLSPPPPPPPQSVYLVDMRRSNNRISL
jgi:hypothetical protein